jgi:uncharacterized protein YjbI with pentapeptide repeats
MSEYHLVRWPEWTGVGERRWKKAPDEEVQPGKTVWDWVQLLIVPLVLGFGVAWWNHEAASRDHNRQDRVQQDATLQAYLDRMGDLMLHDKLLTSGSDDAVRKIARGYTLTALRSVDGERKADIARFLYEARLLVIKDTPVHVAGANLAGASLARANLGDALLGNAPLGGADLKGANLRGADLSGADLQDADLGDADLREANLEGANLARVHLKKAKLRKARLGGADFTGADLTSARLGSADLTNARLGGEAVLVGANLVGATMTGAKLSDATLTNADLRTATLRGADLRDATIVDADLRGASLEDADLRGANLAGADLRGTDLLGADLSGATLEDADLREAVLEAADSENPKSVTYARNLDLGSYISGLPRETRKAFLDSQRSFLDSLPADKLAKFNLSPQRLANFRRQASGV